MPAFDSTRYMRYALVLAKKGMGTTSPNPMVGAVLVKDGKVVGKGYHRRKGEAHAEKVAIREAGDRSKGGTLYVTLEPCVHFGSTSPCTDEIIRAGIKKVYIATIDPNPIVDGRGIKKLLEKGVDVEVGLCEKEAVILNETYNKYIKTKEPFVIMKAAITLDGKIATHTYQSRWITCDKSRKVVHKLRSSVDAVLVGLNTVIVDDPLLTTRLVKGKDPKRIVLDSKFSVPSSAKVLGDGCVIATTSSRVRRIAAEVWRLPADRDGRVDLESLLKEAGGKGITSILVEGGRAVFTSFLKRNLFDKFYLSVANKILGEIGVSLVGALDCKDLGDAMKLKFTSVRRTGTDLFITAYPLF